MTTVPPVEHPGSSRRTPVWVVDEDPRTARVLVGLLQMDGFEVETIGTGAAVVERLAQVARPAALVMNVSMARADEVRVVRQIRLGNPSLPIIIVTEYPQLAPRLGAQTEPLPVILTKPVDYAALLEALRASLPRI